MSYDTFFHAEWVAGGHTIIVSPRSDSYCHTARLKTSTARVSSSGMASAW